MSSKARKRRCADRLAAHFRQQLPQVALVWVRRADPRPQAGAGKGQLAPDGYSPCFENTPRSESPKLMRTGRRSTAAGNRSRISPGKYCRALCSR
jgi:hypothetical protein